MENIVSITNVVNVSVTSTPLAMGTPNVNNILILAPSGAIAEDYKIYKTASDVSKDFGTSSLTAKMATQIFSQSPNLLAGDGKLIVAPVAGTEASFATWASASYSSSILDAFKLVSDGDCKITVGSDEFELSGLDFRKISTVDDIAKLLVSKIKGVSYEATADSFTLKAASPGASVSLSIAAPSAGTGTDISTASYLNVDGASETAGAASTGEALEAAILRLKGLVNFCGILSSFVLEADKYLAAAPTVQAEDMILLAPYSTSNEALTEGASLAAAALNKTRALYYGDGSYEDCAKFAAGYVGRMFSVAFAGSRTTLTSNLKSISGCSADGTIDQTMYDALLAAGVDCYPSYAGTARTLSSGANTFFDRVYNQQALKFALQTAGFNYLDVLGKVPQTEEGMDGLKSAVRKICDQFVNNGYIAKGTWNSADTFGDILAFKRNILDFGYYIFSGSIAEQSQADREARKAPLVQVAVKEAGALHSLIINVIAEA